MHPASEPEAGRQSAFRARGLITEILQVGILALVLFLVVRLVVQPVVVNGSSMNNTLYNQDYLVTTVFNYHFHGPERGDIIILHDPYNPSVDFVKRVIALPGERLLIRGGHVYIDGHLLNEPYLRHDEPWTENADYPAGGGSQGLVIPANDYFVMGDNRNHSSDSRAFGPVPKDSIVARAWLRILPLNDFGTVDAMRPSLAPTVSPLASQAA